VLARSRQAMLPESLTKQRIILEARALAETGRSDLAVDLLSAVEGDDIARLAADALWRGEKWQGAAEALERLLSETWQPGQPLNETQSYDVMRAAIGYALAGDDLGSDRIRTKFGSVMANTEEALGLQYRHHADDAQFRRFPRCGALGGGGRYAGVFPGELPCAVSRPGGAKPTASVFPGEVGTGSPSENT
jgi:hypothetical protein